MIGKNLLGYQNGHSEMSPIRSDQISDVWVGLH